MSTTMKKTAVIYSRVSTVKQAEEGLPIQSQIDQCVAKAAALGATVLRQFTDEGISGRTTARPAFQDALAFCAGNRVDYFVVWSTSRFARNRIDAASLKKVLRAGGTRVVYASSDLDTDTDEGWFSESIFEVMDEHYSRMVSKDTMRSMMKNASEGNFNGGTPPFGYVVVKGENRRKKLAIDESEAALIRLSFRKCLEGYGSKHIAMELNKLGITRRGAQWNKTTVTYMLKNPAYAGFTVFNRRSHYKEHKDESLWVRVKSHEAIVSEDQFEQVQKLIVSRAPEVCKGSPHSGFMFTGLLRCGACGDGMQIETASGRSKTYRYYNCRGALKGKKCVNRRLSAEPLDDWLLGEIMNRVLTPERIREVMLELRSMTSSWTKDRDERRSLLAKELRDKERRRSNIFELFELHGKNVPNLADLTVRLRELKAGIEQLENDLMRLEQEKPPQFDIGENQIEEFTRMIDSTVRSSDPKKVRLFLSSFIQRIEVGDENVVVKYDPRKLMNHDQKIVVHSKEIWLPDLDSNQGPAD